MKKTIIAGVSAAMLLFGCDAEFSADYEINDSDLNKQVMNSLNADKSNEAQLLNELKKQDPSITDVHFKGTPENRAIVIARNNPDGTVTTTEVPYNSAIPQEASNGSAGVGSMLGSAALGMAAGYLLANAFSPANNTSMRSMPSSAYHEERERNRSGYVSSAANSYRSSYVSSMRSGVMAGKSGSTATAPKAAPNNIGKSTGGSFSSSGARGGGYAGGSGG